ncbi:hypothetical protein U14_03617 [Candidatus Moduliflexus flocculans]|uniref:Uncharacterized protein n=1 Tax=Candidatus Moduliflexus flocculans TaxID=1499966 RepID=A0A081BPQ0_9BACT|nr:hypothetical protein U14_03617 [Candidatus Moduliflexus flocculans]
MKQNSILIVGIIGALIGTRFADIDSALPFLTHRSIITHGVIFPLMIWFIAIKYSNTGWRLFAIGFSMAMAVHLCFDLYPRGWAGFALIHVPGIGRLSKELSWSWIACNIIVTQFLALWLAWKMRDIILAIVSAGIPFFVHGQKEAFSSPLLTFGVILAATFWLSEQETWVKKKIRTTNE